jgi:hypothetical protein
MFKVGDKVYPTKEKGYKYGTNDEMIKIFKEHIVGTVEQIYHEQIYVKFPHQYSSWSYAESELTYAEGYPKPEEKTVETQIIKTDVEYKTIFRDKDTIISYREITEHFDGYGVVEIRIAVTGENAKNKFQNYIYSMQNYISIYTTKLETIKVDEEEIEAAVITIKCSRSKCHYLIGDFLAARFKAMFI